MYSVCLVKDLLERGVIVIHILEETLLGELWLGQGLREGTRHKSPWGRSSWARKLDGIESSKSKRYAHCMYGHE